MLIKRHEDGALRGIINGMIISVFLWAVIIGAVLAVRSFWGAH